ncbi:MAG: lysophospholipid acyltransferase family protein [bacterium]|nr:lysophospholipid acyltransferase family protein [bacterium]
MSTSWRKTRKRVKNWFIYILVKLGLRWIRVVKRETAIRSFQTLSLLGFYLVRSERRKTLQHLTMVYGGEKSQQEIYRMAKAVFFNLGRNMADAFRIPLYNSENVDQIVAAKGLEHLDRALAKGNGVLALTGHVGNWELMGGYLAIKGYPINVVGAPIYDPRLDALVVQNRQQSGMKYIARGSATREIIRALRRNEVIGLLIDQDTKHVEGVFVDFLGKNAFTPAGPALLAAKTGAAIVPMAIHITKDNTHLIDIEDELDVQTTADPENDRIYNTQIFSKAVEKFIRLYPTQWVWMHRRWKTMPRT